MYDPFCASLVDSQDRVFQVLKPIEYQDIETTDETGEAVSIRVQLPREWDEEATRAAYDAANT